MSIDKYIYQKGFTLVELSMVLFVIGLIALYIIKGEALVYNVKAKKAGDSLVDIQTAVYAYLDRKGELPGQIETGVIGSTKASIDSADDFFADLSGEGFILSQSIVPPSNIATDYEVYYVVDQATADIGNAIFIQKNQLCLTGVESEVAQGIDGRLDDGRSAIGDVRAELDVNVEAIEYEKGKVYTVCLRL